MPTTKVKENKKTKTEEDKKDELLLDSLEIKGYRCFEHLTIEKLGRVNLIVGKNSVGKTALLEALWLYTNGAIQDFMFEILRERNEIPPLIDGKFFSQPQSSRGLKNLIYNRPNLEYIPGDYPPEFDKNLEITIGEVADINGSKTKYGNKSTQISFHRLTSTSSDAIPRVTRVPEYRKVTNQFIRSNGLNTYKMLEFWDFITLTPSEDKVINALSLLLPAIKRIDFIGFPSGSDNRVPVVRVSNEKERIPLKSFGEGMTRLLGIALTLVQCENGMLIIDEIESGLHYSVLPDVWKLIFKTAKELNVQVFATTHSNDCIKAFAQAAYDSPEEGMLIRLERQGEKIIAKTIEEETLVDAVDYRVEVR